MGTVEEVLHKESNGTAAIPQWHALRSAVSRETFEAVVRRNENTRGVRFGEPLIRILLNTWKYVGFV